MDEGDVSEMFEDHREVEIDEYETDSDDNETENEEHLELVKRACIEGLPGVLGNKGTLAKYPREQGDMSLFLGKRGTNLTN